MPVTVIHRRSNSAANVVSSGTASLKCEAASRLRGQAQINFCLSCGLEECIEEVSYELVKKTPNKS